jgi:DnaJ-class molecular chaperone
MNMGSSSMGGRGGHSTMGGFPMGAGMSSIFGDSFAQQQGGIPMQQRQQQQQPVQQQKSPPIEHQLQVSLEDLYNGATKKMRITKKTLNGGTAATDKVKQQTHLKVLLSVEAAFLFQQYPIHILKLSLCPRGVSYDQPFRNLFASGCVHL